MDFAVAFGSAEVIGVVLIPHLRIWRALGASERFSDDPSGRLNSRWHI
jgi:hypothetical protein